MVMITLYAKQKKRHRCTEQTLECLFKRFFAVCISSLVGYLFRSLSHFKITLFIVSLSFKNSLHILDTISLSDVSFPFPLRLQLVFSFFIEL